MERTHPTDTDEPVTNQPIDGRDLQHDDPLDASRPGDGSGTAPGAAVGANEDIEGSDPAVTDQPR